MAEQRTFRALGGVDRGALPPAGEVADALRAEFERVFTLKASLRGEADADDPVFRSRKGGALDPSAAWRIVKAAAERAGLWDRVAELIRRRTSPTVAA